MPTFPNRPSSSFPNSSRANLRSYWDVGPHDPVSVEETWRKFVRSVGGIVLADELPPTPNFENADFCFRESRCVLELKEVETEFSNAPAFTKGFDALMRRLIAQVPDWRPALFGGPEAYPLWFRLEFIRLFRPPISRILKKANRQIRDTKAHLTISAPTGVLLFVNDGFTTIGPGLVRALASSLLKDSYSSIDCFVYLTVNRYVELPGSRTPRLLWMPSYSDRASEDLVTFVNTLGSQWFDYLERKLGPFTERSEIADSGTDLRGLRSIVLPNE